MDSNKENMDLSVGRARGHSMLSTLKATAQEQRRGGEQHRGHPGMSFERPGEVNGQDVNEDGGIFFGKRPSLAAIQGRVTPGARVSALAVAVQADGSSSVPVSAPIAIQSSTASPINDGFPFDSGCNYDQGFPMAGGEEEGFLRKWCTGQPPKRSFLSSDGVFAPRGRMSRRSTLADKPELDVLLATTKVKYNGHLYLPLTAQTIHRLSPFFKGAKPIADMRLFECVVINHEINGVHADHVVAALERIGEYCKHLLVMSPIQTSELGNVFNREAGNVNPGSDWDHILKCFPDLKRLAFIHPIDEPVELSRGTFYALHAAVVHRQAAQDLKSFKYEGLSQLITNFHHDFAVAQAAVAVHDLVI